MPDLSYVATGGLIFTNPAYSPTRTHYGYYINEQFTWHVAATVHVDIDSQWDVGEQILRYYQVEGSCQSPPTCDITGYDPTDETCAGGGLRFIEVIAARGLSDLCDKLKTRQLNYPLKWPVARIRRYSRPVLTTDIDSQEALGVDVSCNSLETQVFCHVPECFDFCIDSDLTTEFSCTVTLQDNFLNTVAEGGLSFGGSALINLNNGTNPSGGFVMGGQAIVVFSRYATSGSGGLVISGHSLLTLSEWHYTATGGLVISGSSLSDSPNQHYTASGGLIMGGQAIVREHLAYTSGISTLVLSGTPLLKKSGHIVGSGGLIFGGTALQNCNRYRMTASGGLILGGLALIRSTNWHYTPSSGFVFGGEIGVARHYVASGGFTLGASPASTSHLHYVGSGTLVFGGTALIKNSPTWHYNYPSGLTFGGTALTSFVIFGTLESLFGSETELLLFEPIFSVSTASGNIAADTRNVIAECGCDPMPNILKMSHNMNLGTNFRDFLTRNNLTLAEQVNLIYNEHDNAWRAAFHFTGTTGTTTETWIVLFEWACSSDIGSYALGSVLWKFSVLLKRTSDKSDQTRILYSFPIESVCVNNVVRFSFKINTQTNELTSPSNLMVRDSIIYDEIGIFTGSTWEKNPNLTINIFESNLPITSPTVDIKPIFSN